MSVLRRMMLWSVSWKISTRLRPRSFAALQAISALARPCARRFRDSGGSSAAPTAHRDLHGAVAAHVGELRALAAQHLPDLVREIERAVGQEHREAVAGDARRERAGPRLLAQHLGDLADHLVADVHAEVVVDQVHAVDVEVQHALGHRLAPRRELAAHLRLERGAREQRRQLVEVVLQRGRDLARQQLDEPLGARLEVGRVFGAEQREEPAHAARGMAYRRAQDLVGRQLDRAHLDLVDHQVAALQLRPVEQVPVDLGQQLDLRPLAARSLASRDVCAPGRPAPRGGSRDGPRRSAPARRARRRPSGSSGSVGAILSRSSRSSSRDCRSRVRSSTLARDSSSRCRHSSAG